MANSVTLKLEGEQCVWNSSHILVGHSLCFILYIMIAYLAVFSSKVSLDHFYPAVLDNLIAYLESQMAIG